MTRPGRVPEFERQRTTLSAYGRVHWGDFDREEPLPRESSLASLLESALGLLDSPQASGSGMWIDLGCGAGRATYELATRGAVSVSASRTVDGVTPGTQGVAGVTPDRPSVRTDLVVGVDLSFAMLRLAERVRHAGLAVFPLRRVGLVFDRRELRIPDVPAERMSFWCCDVDNLPFPDASFAGALSLNVPDCVPSPLQHLAEMGRVLTPEATALLTTPYDWAATATPVAQWLGGHSQRGEAHGSSAAELRRALLTVDTGLSIAAEQDRVPWRVYVNERASMDYAVHLLRLIRRAL